MSLQSIFSHLPEFPALHALVTTTALIIEGTTFIPAFTAAIANGDAPASPECAVSASSSDGTIMPTKKMVIM